MLSNTTGPILEHYALLLQHNNIWAHPNLTPFVSPLSTSNKQTSILRLRWSEYEACKYESIRFIDCRIGGFIPEDTGRDILGFVWAWGPNLQHYLYAHVGENKEIGESQKWDGDGVIDDELSKNREN